MIGTFAIVFFGCGTIVEGVAGHLGVNVVFGAVVAAMVFGLGHISCAHFNPAVTVGFAVVKRFPWGMAAPYIVAQIGGAFLACALLRLLLPELAPQSSFGATVPTVSLVCATGIEAVLTFFLMLVIVSVATDGRVSSGFAGIAIGLWVMLAGLMAGPLTGCGMNPARSLGPALFSGGEALTHLTPYIIGPMVGTVAGALVYEFLRASRAEDRLCPTSCCAQE